MAELRPICSVCGRADGHDMTACGGGGWVCPVEHLPLDSHSCEYCVDVPERDPEADPPSMSRAYWSTR